MTGLKKRVYICSPLSGNIKHNMLMATEYCKFTAEQSYIPYAPHVYFPSFMDDNDPEQRALGLSEGQLWLRMCSELWIFGSVISAGMKGEIEAAMRIGIPIRLFTSDVNPVPVLSAQVDYGQLSQRLGGMFDKFLSDMAETETILKDLGVTNGENRI